MIDDTKVEALQARYKASGDSYSLTLFYLECRNICLILIKSQCEKKHLCFTPNELNEYAHDAATHFIELYLKNPSYSAYNLRNRLYFDVIAVLHKRSKINWEMRRETLSEALGLNYPEQVARENNTEYYIQDIIASHPQGQKVVYILYKSLSYSSAIKKITKLTDKKFVYDYCKELYRIFRVLKIQ